LEFFTVLTVIAANPSRRFKKLGKNNNAIKERKKRSYGYSKEIQDGEGKNSNQGQGPETSEGREGRIVQLGA